MFKNLKKILVWIPCMVVAFFLFSGTRAEAAKTKGDAILVNGEKEVIGTGGKKNTYYFSNDDYWEFLVTDYSLSAFKGGDRFVKWRVIKPAGQATEWHGNGYDSSVYYVDNKGKFTIKNFASLSYSKSDTVDGFDRMTIADGATYFVDIQYYSHLVWSTHQEGKDETLKIIVSDAVPVINTTYNASNNRLSVSAGFAAGESGAITNIEYFFTNSSKSITGYGSFKSIGGTSVKSLDITPSTSASGSITVDQSSKYLYIAVVTGNGENVVNIYEVADILGSGSGEVNDGNHVGSDEKVTDTDNNKGSGFGDYDLGQMILIILVIVLIVSCALIITQKIVDYKKRLY